MKQSRRVNVIIDGKEFASKGNEVELKIDGVRVYSTPKTWANKPNVEDFQWTGIKSFLKASDSALSHIDRFRISKSLAESPKSFTEIKQLLNTTSATTNFHLKTLIEGLIIYKDENGRYALTLLGELILDYFSKFLAEASRLEAATSS